MECRLCLRSTADSFEFNSEEGIKQQALILLQKHFSFCFMDNRNGDRVCRQCWKSVDSFNTFYLQIQDIHVHIFSLKNVKIMRDVSVRRIDEAKGFEQSDPVIVKVESLAAKNESSISHVLETDLNLNADLDVKWTPETNETSVLYTENAFDTHLGDDTSLIQSARKNRKKKTSLASKRSQVSDFQNNSDMNCESKSGPLSMDSDRKEPSDTNLKDETNPSGSRAARGQDKQKVKTQCPKCSDWFLTRAQFKHHMKKTHNVHRFKCDTHNCVQSFETTAELDEHKSEKHVKVPCPHCKKELGRVYLIKHIKMYHSKVDQVICDVCGHVSADKGKHKMHNESKHMDARAQCDICGQWYKNKNRIRNHMRDLHINKPTPVKCDICGKICPNKYAAWGHKTTHKEGYRSKFKCIICGKGFVNGQKMRMHVASHEGMNKSLLNRFKCDTCGKTFRERTKLREHSYIHSGITDAHKCDFCAKPFRFYSAMSRHRQKQHPEEDKRRKMLQKSKTLK